MNVTEQKGVDMQLSSLANGVTPQNAAVTASTLKKAEEADQNAIAKMLEESNKQLEQIREQEDAKRRQNVAVQTGLGVNLNITA